MIIVSYDETVAGIRIIGSCSLLRVANLGRSVTIPSNYRTPTLPQTPVQKFYFHFVASKCFDKNVHPTSSLKTLNKLNTLKDGDVSCGVVILSTDTHRVQELKCVIRGFFYSFKEI